MPASPIADADTLLQSDEGRSNKLYKDSQGFQSIGVGYCIELLGLPDDIVDDLYHRRRKVAVAAAERIFGFAFNPTDPRHAAAMNMAYQLGETGLRAFIHLRACWEAEKWAGAGDAVEDSLYAKQAPNRAKRVAALIRTGSWACLADLA